MWWIYSKDSKFSKNKDDENGDLGVMIYITFKKDKSYDDLFIDSNIKCQKVNYIKQTLFKKYIKDGKVDCENNIGFIKSNYWKYEKEFRYVLIENFVYDNQYKDININFDAIEKIDIYYNPNNHDNIQNALRKYIKEKVGDFKIKICIHSSMISNIFKKKDLRKVLSNETTRK